jgi:hypothetical protein
MWENPAYCEFYEILVSYIFHNLYHRANLPTSFRPIARFPLEIQRFVYDRATPIKIEKLRPEGAHVWRFRTLRIHQKSIKWPWAEPFEITAKVELGSNFVVDNESQFFSDALEAKKVS